MNDESQKEKLRQHFARRVTTQARVVLDTWQKISENRGQAESLRAVSYTHLTLPTKRIV